MPVTTLEELEALYGEVHPRAVAKEQARLDRHCKDFIAAAPFFVLATSDGHRLDISPKGDPAGSVLIPDDHTLLIADRPGNNRIDGLRNILQHDQVTAIFLIPTVRETLRIRGRASIHAEPEVLDLCTIDGRRPITVTKIAVETAFIHCAKAFLRSGLWDPSKWPAERPIAPMGEILNAHCKQDEPVESEEQMIRRYSEILY